MNQEKEINRFNKHINRLFEKCSFMSPWDFTDKGQSVYAITVYILNRVMRMFKYSGLPETIPERDLKLLLLVNGYTGILKVNDDIWAMRCGLGGEPNVYYMPTIATFANPALNYSANLKIGDECVIVPNDSLYMGLMPIINKYATLLMESELSFKIALINSRIISLISAPDDASEASANKYLSDIEKGKLGAIGENAFLEGIRSQPYGSSGNSNNIQSIVEGMQYIRATLFNELGLSANFNMKREALNSAESAINNDILLPLIDDMYETQKAAFEKVNEMFNLNITIDRASSWEDNQKEVDIETDESEEENALENDAIKQEKEEEENDEIPET